MNENAGFWTVSFFNMYILLNLKKNMGEGKYLGWKVKFCKFIEI